MLKHKKAFIIGSLVTFYAILVLVLIFVIFGLLFRLGAVGRKAEITSITNEIEGNKMFLNYLRAPITEEPMIDLISKESKDYQLIKEETQTIFEELGGSKPFQILLNIDTNKCILRCGTIMPAACAARIGLNNILLPLPKEEDSVNIGFCAWLDYSKTYRTKEYECMVGKGCK
tara:strand:- start:7779 stop:8297 length:519 start_codon:yes stop_codon:yes gene_type:complete